MKKFLKFALLLGLLVCSVADASTMLTGNLSDKHYEHIEFVAGTGEMEQVFDNKLKITALAPISSSTVLGVEALPHNNPGYHVYYFRVNGGLLLANMTLDHVLGVEGMELNLENLTSNPMIVHWCDSAIQIGEDSSMPLVNEVQFTADGKPKKPQHSIIPPKSSVQVKVYSPSNKTLLNDEWINLRIPISDDGTTRMFITVKVEEGGTSKYYSYKSPCLNLNAEFLATHKDANTKAK